MTLNQLKRKYMAEGFRKGYKRALLLETFSTTPESLTRSFIGICFEKFLQDVMYPNGGTIPGSHDSDYYWLKRMYKKRLSFNEQMELFDQVDLDEVMEKVASYPGIQEDLEELNLDKDFLINKKNYNKIYQEIVSLAKEAATKYASR